MTKKSRFGYFIVTSRTSATSVAVFTTPRQKPDQKNQSPKLKVNGARQCGGMTSKGTGYTKSYFTNSLDKTYSSGNLSSIKQNQNRPHS